MTDEPTHPDNPRSAARNSRLRDALRENLKRRKMQSRGRASLPDHATAAEASPGADPAQDIRSRQADPETHS